MAKISKEAKHIYSERISDFKKKLDDTTKKVQQMKLILQSDDTGAAFKRLLISDELMKVASVNCIMNRLSLDLLGIKNEFFINEARKACYEALVFLEAVFSNAINVPYTEYEPYLKEIATYPVQQKYFLI